MVKGRLVLESGSVAKKSIELEKGRFVAKSWVVRVVYEG